MRIAIVGAGISGNSAAWALSRKHDVTVYEKRDYVGGHSATKRVNAKGGIPVDTGFIVYNEQNYPLLVRLFEHLGVATQQTEMAFSVSLDKGKLEWCGTGLKGVFAQRRNMFSPGFLFMLNDIFRFNRRAHKDLKSGALCGLSLQEYLDLRGFSQRLKDDYLVPMTSAIWSTPSQKMLDFPAESLIQFMKNHALMQAKRPQWRTVVGGSQTYVSLLQQDTPATFRKNCAVAKVARTKNGILVTDTQGNSERYDHVIMACHTDQALRLLETPSPLETKILSSIAYVSNDVWLHQDASLMPKRRDAWAAWNYLGDTEKTGKRSVSVTYWMNKLQHVDDDVPLFVTLNPLAEPDADKTIGRYTYDHPLFDKKAVAAQSEVEHLQGKQNTWYCGAWTGYGFHEDGLRSGLAIAAAFDCPPPWETQTKYERQLELA